MSGGHWNYMSFRIEEAADQAKEALEILAAIEHELDWGICGDTCYSCAKLRTVAAIESLFNYWAGEGEDDDKTWRKVIRDREQNRCADCQALYRTNIPHD